MTKTDSLYAVFRMKTKDRKRSSSITTKLNTSKNTKSVSGDVISATEKKLYDDFEGDFSGVIVVESGCFSRILLMWNISNYCY